MSGVVNALRAQLITSALVRDPATPGLAGRPWLPPVWRHPDQGAVGPGDALEQGKQSVSHDDGLVLSILYAPGIPPSTGAEERRIDGVDLVLRGRATNPILDLEAGIRVVLLGQDPGGRTDWTMGGLYVVQSRQWRPLAPLGAADGIFTFSVGYTFETRAI